VENALEEKQLINTWSVFGGFYASRDDAINADWGILDLTFLFSIENVRRKTKNE
jgi:hypothetical protein